MGAKSISLGEGPAAPAADGEAMLALVQAFDGVCKVGIFYPTGHVLCDSAAEEFLRSLIKVIGPAAGLTVKVEAGILRVQGVALSAANRETGRMRDLFASLDVVRVDLHRDLTASDLYAFVRALFTHRARLRNEADAGPLAVADLPSRVRVRLRQSAAPAEAAETGSSEPIDHLMTLRSPAGDQPSAGNRPKLAPDPLHEFMAEGAFPDLAVLAGDDRRPYLALLMLLQRRELKPAARTRLERALREAIATGLTAEEEECLGDALREMAADGQTCLAPVSVLVSGSLRRLAPNRGLAFLCRLALRCDEDQFAGLWPFLVNEILVAGPGDDPQLWADATALAASLADEAARVALPRLESLECLHGQRVAAGVFRAPSADLRRILAWFLETTRGAQVARQLATETRRTPTDWLAGAVLPLIEQGTAAERQFLAAWLRHRDPAHPGDDLLQPAGPLLAVGLARLAAARRQEPWVAAAVTALGRCRTPQGRQLLQQILAEKRALVVPVWPAACRRAAATAITEAA